jgi:hypothetical protein
VGMLLQNINKLENIYISNPFFILLMAALSGMMLFACGELLIILAKPYQDKSKESPITSTNNAPKKLYLYISGISLFLLLLFDVIIYFNLDYYGMSAATFDIIVWTILFGVFAIYFFMKYRKNQ